jgi:hypothetical protein
MAAIGNTYLSILNPAESASLRADYIAKFIDTSSQYYIERIAKKHQFPDGSHAIGYLWESILKSTLITYERFCEHVVCYNEVLSLADDHSRSQVIGGTLWPFPPYSVIKTPPNLLLQLLPALPEDLYVFDRTFAWTLILTHEHNAQQRICVAVGLEKSNTPRVICHITG